MKAKFQLRLYIPIVLKLGGIIMALMLAATVPIALKSSEFFENVSGQREKDANRNQVSAKASEVEGLLTNYRDKLRVIASLLLRHSNDPKEREAALRLSFQEDREFANIEIYEYKNGKIQLLHRISQDNFLKESELGANYFSELRAQRPFPVSSVFARNIEIQNSSLPDGAPLLTIGEGLVEDERGQTTHIAVADIRLHRLQKIFSAVSDRTFYLLDKAGQVVAHPNDKWVLERKDLSAVGLARKAKDSRVRIAESRFLDPETRTWFIGAFALTSYGLQVMAQASEDIIYEPSRQVRRQAFFITGLVLSGALFLIFSFSITLTSPIEKLVDVTRAVAAGNFDVQSNVTSHDEVGELAHSFDKMIHGLRERDKMRNVLNKFHGSAVAEDLLKGDLQLGGSNREVTVFFSDIRDFTKFSEGHTPEEVVSMLNEYFAIMVGIISANHGIVDKFVGDAIMAVWGAPNATDEDSYFAVRACLEMRSALEKLNQTRLSRGQVEIKMGMGLHAGRAISGTIGSSERMEYTVIGDAVNMASRIEASTKSFGTDLLVSDTISEKLKERFILEFAGAAEVKGKAEPLKMFKVTGFISETGAPVIVKTKYSDFASGDDEKVKKVA